MDPGDKDPCMLIEVGTCAVLITKEQAMSFFDLQPRYNPDEEMGFNTIQRSTDGTVTITQHTP